MRKASSTLSLLLCLLAAPAVADWEYTKWGMTPDQVTAASKGHVHTHERVDGKSSDDTDSLASGRYSAAGFDFDADFNFDKVGGGLSLVDLTLHPTSRCFNLFGALKDIYGPPQDEAGTTNVFQGFVWRDRESGNHVTLLMIGRDVAPVSCVLKYGRLHVAGKGL